MNRPRDRVLLVEGPEDRFVWSALANQLFGQEAVWVDILESVDKPKKIDAYLVGSQVTHLSIVVDADDSAERRYQSLRDRLSRAGYRLPAAPPAAGCRRPEGGPLVGCWVCPDNRNPGYLEDMLWQCIDAEPSADFPDKAALEAHLDGLAPELFRYGPRQRSKALFRTWLTWSSEPDLKSGDALRRHHLNLAARPPLLEEAIEWLRATFEL